MGILDPFDWDDEDDDKEEDDWLGWPWWML